RAPIVHRGYWSKPSLLPSLPREQVPVVVVLRSAADKTRQTFGEFHTSPAFDRAVTCDQITPSECNYSSRRIELDRVSASAAKLQLEKPTRKQNQNFKRRAPARWCVSRASLCSTAGCQWATSAMTDCSDQVVAAAGSKQRRHDRNRNDSDINDAVGDAKRQRDCRLAIKLGGLAHPFDRLDHAGTGVFPHDAAQARQQAVGRAEPLRRRSAAAGEPIDSLPDQLIDAEERHNVLDAGDGDAKLALEPARGIDRERAGADQGGITASETEGLDLNAAA